MPLIRGEHRLHERLEYLSAKLATQAPVFTAAKSLILYSSFFSIHKAEDEMNQTQFQIRCENLATKLRAQYHGRADRFIAVEERATLVIKDIGVALYARSSRPYFFDPGSDRIYDYLISLVRSGGQAWRSCGEVEFRFMNVEYFILLSFLRLQMFMRIIFDVASV